jgi:hypothetical protein
MQCVIASFFCTLSVLASAPLRVSHTHAQNTHTHTHTHTSFCEVCMCVCVCKYVCTSVLHYVLVWLTRDLTHVTDAQALLKFWLEYYLYR